MDLLADFLEIENIRIFSIRTEKEPKMNHLSLFPSPSPRRLQSNLIEFY